MFFMHSKVPATVFVVKDRVLGHNPVAALYTTHSYYRRLTEIARAWARRAVTQLWSFGPRDENQWTTQQVLGRSVSIRSWLHHCQLTALGPRGQRLGKFVVHTIGTSQSVRDQADSAILLGKCRELVKPCRAAPAPAGPSVADPRHTYQSGALTHVLNVSM